MSFQRRELRLDGGQFDGVDVPRVRAVQDPELRALLGTRLLLRPVLRHGRTLRPHRGDAPSPAHDPEGQTTDDVVTRPGGTDDG